MLFSVLHQLQSHFMATWMVALILCYPMSPATDYLQSPNGHKWTHSEIISCKEEQCAGNILERLSIKDAFVGLESYPSTKIRLESGRSPFFSKRRFVPNPSSKTRWRHAIHLINSTEIWSVTRVNHGTLDPHVISTWLAEESNSGRYNLQNTQHSCCSLSPT